MPGVRQPRSGPLSSYHRPPLTTINSAAQPPLQLQEIADKIDPGRE